MVVFQISSHHPWPRGEVSLTRGSAKPLFTGANPVVASKTKIPLYAGFLFLV